jgi:hypothetical protein
MARRRLCLRRLSPVDWKYDILTLPRAGTHHVAQLGQLAIGHGASPATPASACYVSLWPRAEAPDRARYFRSLGATGRALPGAEIVEDDPKRSNVRGFYLRSSIAIVSLAGT